MFRNSNVNKFFLVSRDREIITVKSLKSKKKKLALTLFYYASREIMVGQFKKAYLHRPIKILHFLTPAIIQINLTSKYLRFFSNKPAASSVTDITRDFLTYHSCSYCSFMVP